MVEKNNPLKKRNLKAVKWLSSTPVVAVCTPLRPGFRVLMTPLSRTVEAQSYIQQQFGSQMCQPEDAGLE
jgi:hypothetical protein